MTIHWYVLHSHPHKEDQLHQQLLIRGVDCYYPRLRGHPINPRARKFVPYFPGYIFLHANLDLLGITTFQWMPFTTGLVLFGGEPAAVPDLLIHELQIKLSRMDLANGLRSEALCKGDRILIHSGLFAGFDGIFDIYQPGKERVRVLLKLLGQGREIPVEVDMNQIAPGKNRVH